MGPGFLDKIDFVVDKFGQLRIVVKCPKRSTT